MNVSERKNRSTLFFIAYMFLFPKMTWAISYEDFKEWFYSKNFNRVLIDELEGKIFGRGTSEGLTHVPELDTLKVEFPILFEGYSPKRERVIEALMRRRTSLLEKARNRTTSPLVIRRAPHSILQSSSQDLELDHRFAESQVDMISKLNSLSLTPSSCHEKSLGSTDSENYSFDEFETVDPSQVKSADFEIATHLVDLLERRYSIDPAFKLDQRETVIQGLTSYFNDRRTRKAGLSRKQLIRLIFDPEDESDQSEPDRALASLSLKHLKLNDWLKTFEDLSVHSDTGQPSRNSDTHFNLDALKHAGVDLSPYSRHPTLRFSQGSSSDVVALKHGQDSSKPVLFYKANQNQDLLNQVKSALGEVAAYRLNRLLRLDVVENTHLVVRHKDGKVVSIGSVRHAVPADFKQAVRISSSKLTAKDGPWASALSELRVIDYVMATGDRHAENIFVKPSMDREPARIKGIDYPGVPLSIRFNHPFYDLSGGRLPTVYTNPDLNRRIEQVTFNEIRHELGGVATMEEMEAIWMRLQILRKDLREKLRSK